MQRAHAGIRDVARAADNVAPLLVHLPVELHPQLIAGPQDVIRGDRNVIHRGEGGGHAAEERCAEDGQIHAGRLVHQPLKLRLLIGGVGAIVAPGRLVAGAAVGVFCGAAGGGVRVVGLVGVLRPSGDGAVGLGLHRRNTRRRGNRGRNLRRRTRRSSCRRSLPLRGRVRQPKNRCKKCENQPAPSLSREPPTYVRYHRLQCIPVQPGRFVRAGGHGRSCRPLRATRLPP